MTVEGTPTPSSETLKNKSVRGEETVDAVDADADADAEEDVGIEVDANVDPDADEQKEEGKLFCGADEVEGATVPRDWSK